MLTVDERLVEQRPVIEFRLVDSELDVARNAYVDPTSLEGKALLRSLAESIAVHVIVYDDTARERRSFFYVHHQGARVRDLLERWGAAQSFSIDWGKALHSIREGLADNARD
ncbi:MAG: hypothetical protein R3A47_00725 [Polyangiales bacterium]